MSIRATAIAAWREWRLAAKEPKLYLTLIVVAVLTILALLTGWHRAQQRLMRQQTIQRNNAMQKQFLKSAFDENASTERDPDLTQTEHDRKLALQMSARSPDLMRFTGGLWTSHLPVSSLTGLSMGAAGEWPEHYRHAGSSVTQTLTREMRPNPLLAVTGAYDMSLLIGVILPLTVMILTFDVAAADRENGRWALIQTQSQSIPRLIAMRCLVPVIALAGVVNLLLIVSAMAFPIGDLIALALVRQARGLLLDEPTSGLDPQSAHEFSKVLRGLADQGVSILMASHDLYNVRESATKIGIMRKGELVEALNPAEVDHSELAARALDLM